ncbi:MFS transporter [Sphingopyxis sp. USTB-05]|uniref:spinster family MFS transporter n=1 Tax=Sphingopyxis sp. USTB-05 TaxID=2830667 RepID=UPI002078B46A|nr:MFS transporter [Sphingopyxis sp. USTB-05]USI77593.1 MFS transporter [Sphingopyxis sp. USTB-05]
MTRPNPAIPAIASQDPTDKIPLYTWYVLGLLILVNAINFMDRWSISVLVEYIKADLQLTDTEIGLLTGAAFSVGYSVSALPIAWLADRGNRRNILAAALTVWSVMTGFTGLAQNFWQIIVARVGTGAGESGCIPTGQSIISDLFPKEKRPFALSLFSSGVMLGKVLGIGGAGILVALYGWRATLLILAVPGLLVALLVRLTMKDPPHGQFDGFVANAAPVATWPAFRALFTTPSYMLICVALAFSNLVIFGLQNWVPAFYMRSHGLSAAQIGSIIAVVVGLGGAFGLIAGGYLTQRLMTRDPRWAPWLAAMCHSVACGCSVLSYMVADATLSLLLFGLSAIILSVSTGGVFATIHNTVDPRIRALAVAFMTLLTSIIGLGGGPLIVGALSDHFTAQYGSHGLRQASIAVASLHVLPAIFYLWSARALLADLAARASVRVEN